MDESVTARRKPEGCIADTNSKICSPFKQGKQPDTINSATHSSISTELRLITHDSQYSSAELLINSEFGDEGDLIGIQLQGKSELYLTATLSQQPQLQVSILNSISTLFDLHPRSIVVCRKIKKIASIVSSRVEIAFRDQYIGRADMWQMNMSLINTSVYVGKLLECPGIRGQVKAIFVNGVEKVSAYVTDLTRSIFRSDTAKFFIFIQMSKEMWEFGEDGEMGFEKCVYGFLPELFSKWKAALSFHVVSIVLFARVLYLQPPEKEILAQDDSGRFFKDFYRVVIDWETKVDWASILFDLKRIFFGFQKDILQVPDGQGGFVICGSNSAAMDGNILESINLALNPFDKHYIDRDLSRTGLSIVIITPSNGIFNVDKKLCRMTTQRMIDNGISLDLVCLARLPLHSVPLFQFRSQKRFKNNSIVDTKFFTERSFASRTEKNHRQDYDGARSQKSGINDFYSAEGDALNYLDHLYTEDDIKANDKNFIFIIPDWINCSFWTRTSKMAGVSNQFHPRCKMYEVQMMGIWSDEKAIGIPSFNFKVPDNLTDLKRACDQHDESLFDLLEENSLIDRNFAQYVNTLNSKVSHAVFDNIQTLRPLPTYFNTEISNKSSSWDKNLLNPQVSNQPKFNDVVHSEIQTDQVYSSSIEPILINRKARDEYQQSSWSTNSRVLSPSANKRSSYVKYSPAKTPVKQCFLRHSYANPFVYNSKSIVGINDRKWGHIPKSMSDKDGQEYTDWTSLCSPACLPLTIEYYPSVEELSELYQEYTYTVSPAYNEDSRHSQLDNQNSIELLLVELVSQRLAQGFQLIVSSKATAICNLYLLVNDYTNPITHENVSIAKSYNVCLGDHVHKLCYDSSGNNVQVKRFTRKINYNVDSISYSCSINRSIVFSYPALTNYNWNYLDHLISGYQDQMTDALRFWRIRFLLIPVELTPSSLSTNSLVEEHLDDEEERLACFKKFTQTMEKAILTGSQSKDKSRNDRKLDIQLTTLNLSSLIKRKDIHSLLPEAFADPNEKVMLVKGEQFSKNSSMESIVSALILPPPLGLPFQDRHWHYEVYENVVTGEEIVNWVMINFAHADTRIQALEIGSKFIDDKILKHVKQKHTLLDGFYFYQFCRQFIKSSNVDFSKQISAKRFQAVKQDPQKKSSRQEIAMLHYDTTHNTRNCYHFQLHWLVCTARLVEDMISTWRRMADKCGFKLVEASGGQASADGIDNPFQSMVPIKLSVYPPTTKVVIDKLEAQEHNLSKDWFERELVAKFDFILDTDSRGFSYQRKSWLHTQFVHRSGSAFIQIMPNSNGFLWVTNRLHLGSNSKLPSILTPSITSDALRSRFQEFCASSLLLIEFYDATTSRLLFGQKDPATL